MNEVRNTARTAGKRPGDRRGKRWVPMLSIAGMMALLWGGIAAAQTIEAPAAAGNTVSQVGGSGITPPGQALGRDTRNPSTVVGGRPEKSLAQAGAEETRGKATSGRGADQRNRAAGLTARGPVDPKRVLTDVSEGLGGCLVEYGTNGQCLPGVPPSMGAHIKQMKDAGQDPRTMPHSWTCREARTYFPQGIAVRQAGIDPQHLDVNGDGTACGPGD